MSEESAKKNKPEIPPERYEIRIQGILVPSWSEWLGHPKMTHTHEGETILSCEIQDQTALHGLLVKIRDMNLKLLAVTRVDIGSLLDEDRDDQD